ncbi:MAG: hypothetical protein M1821_009953 [Bathelium mastoideum]|nr:MAG: hypothetical protein M1821_009953 [Bathelium mastoideum]
MEVVGVIAAVPELITIIKVTTKLVRDVSNSRKALAKITKGLDAQLESLAEALNQIEAKGKSKLASSERVRKLAPLLQQLREQLEGLNDILQAAAQGGGRLKRITMIVGGVEKKLKDQIMRLETSISLLNLNLLECSLALGEETVAASRLTKKVQVKGALNPCGHGFIPKKLDGTLDWVASHPKIVQWYRPSASGDRSSDPISRMLVVYGAKGCGKSVLAASLAYDMKAKGVACAIFSYYHGIERQRKLNALLATILWELLNIEDLPDGILDLVCDSISTELTTEAYLLDTIEKVISLYKKPIHIIIDAIDESAEDWNDSEGPLRAIRGWLGKHPTLQVLLVGRKSGLQLALRVLQDTNIIELSEDVTKDDISRFIAYKLQESPNLDAMSTELKLHLQEALLEKSTGMFLWVELVFKELRKCYSPAAVRECLGELPRSLDDEYSRLFKQVMHRLYGSHNKPSTQTKATRALLAFIVGTIEPLSVDDLRYAYAALCSAGPNWEDHLISEPAVLDFLGDFVAFKEGHVHFSHASVEEFLLRPLSEWHEDQNEIEFFRLDRAECQKLVGTACLNYLTVIDLGYPITDRSYTSLSSKPFISYSTRFGPLHWTHSLAVDPSTLPGFVASFKAFIATPQFGRLVEYVVASMLDDFRFMDDCLHFLLLFEASSSELVECALVRLSTESARRLDQFGPTDERTQSWLALGDVCVDLFASKGLGGLTHGLLNDPVKAQLLSRSSIEPLRDSDPQGSSYEPVSLLGKESNQVLTDNARDHRNYHLVGKKEAMDTIMHSNLKAVTHIPSLSRTLGIWPDPREIHRKMIQAMVEKMPVPLHLLYADQARLRGHEKLGQSLFKSAVRRTEGKRTPYRAPALTGAGAYSLFQCGAAESEIHYSQAYDVVSKIPNNPLAYIWTLQVMDNRINALSYLDELDEIVSMIDRSVLGPVVTPSSSFLRWRDVLFDRFVYKRKWWLRHVISRLETLASTLIRESLFNDAHRILESLIENKRLLFGPHHWRVIHAQVDAGNSLLLGEDYSKAEKYFRDILSSHDEKDLIKGQYLIAVARFKLAKAVYFQGRHNDSMPLFQDARDHPSRKDCARWHQKCTIFICRCLRRNGDFEAAKKALETISAERVVDSLRKSKAPGPKGGNLFWNAICSVYSHLEEYENALAVRKTMHALLDDSRQLAAYKTSNALELIKLLKQVCVYEEAVEFLTELNNRFEAIMDGAGLRKQEQKRMIMGGRATILELLKDIPGSEKGTELGRTILRSCREDLDWHYERSSGPIPPPLWTKAELEICCETSEIFHGPDLPCTLRFRHYLSLSYRRNEVPGDEFSDTATDASEDEDLTESFDDAENANTYMNKEANSDQKLDKDEDVFRDFEDEEDQVSDYFVELENDEDFGTDEGEGPIFGARLIKKFQSIWSMPQYGTWEPFAERTMNLALPALDRILLDSAEAYYIRKET